MNENAYVQAVPQPEKKKSGGNMAWIICLILGAVLFSAGLIIYKVSDNKYYETKDYNESFSAENVTKLDIDTEWADLTISRSKDDMIHINAIDVPEAFTADIKNGTFTTYYQNSTPFYVHLPRFLQKSYSSSTVEIELPEKEYKAFILDMGAGETQVSDIECDKFRVDCGAGNVSFTNIKCTEGNVECGAGEVTISNIDCKNKLKVDGGAGQITINGTLGGIDVDQGFGEFVFNGTINGNIDADGGVGEVTFNLTNPSSDFGSNGKYRLDIDTGVGSSSVNYDQK